MTEEPKKRPFLTMEQAAEVVNVSPSEIRALLKTGELHGIQVGGRGYLARLLGVEDCRRIFGPGTSNATQDFCSVRDDR